MKFLQYGHFALKLGAGFFADAYALFVTDIVVQILKDIDKDQGGSLGVTPTIVALISLASSLGAVVGMIAFGLAGDSLGRRTSSLVTATLIFFGSIFSGLVFRHPTFDLVWQLILVRFILGIGIGGEYPLSATLAREQCPCVVDRSHVVAAVFSMQGVGMLVSMLLALLFSNTAMTMDFIWRTLLIIGFVPAAVAFAIRIRMVESPQFIEHQRAHTEAFRGISTIDKVINEVRELWHIRRSLFCTSMCWLLLDVSFYGTGQFKRTVSDVLFPGPFSSSHAHASATAKFGVYISLMGIPGYLIAAYLIDSYISPKKLQLIGFVVLGGVYIALAAVGVSAAHPEVGLVLFGLSFFVSNIGPNTTTFVTPSQLFPETIRTTANGIAAASGKIGAVIGSYVFAALPLTTVLWICVAMAFSGFLVTLPCPETTARSLSSLRARPHNDPVVGSTSSDATSTTLSTEATGGTRQQEATTHHPDAL